MNEGASINEIKNAYRRLVLEYHPDKNISAKDGLKFKIISEAYHTLREKNNAGVTTNHRTEDYTINKNQQYGREGFRAWLNLFYGKIDYRYAKYVKNISFYYLKYEPIMFEYYDKIERNASILTHRSIGFFRHYRIRTIFRIITLSCKLTNVQSTTKEFKFMVILFSCMNHLRIKERVLRVNTHSQEYYNTCKTSRDPLHTNPSKSTKS